MYKQAKGSPGAFDENFIRQGLALKGWFVIPTANIEDGGAPMAKSSDACLILPDLQAMSEGKTIWVEVKRKTRAQPMRIEGNTLKHGFCARQYEHYAMMEFVSKITLWIFIWETSTRTICYAPLGYLKYPQIAKSDRVKDIFCEHGMAFFRRDDFWQMKEHDFEAGIWKDSWLKTRNEYQKEEPEPKQESQFKLF
jgi:hypothetical protein